MSAIPVLFAQVTNAASAAVAGSPDAAVQPERPIWSVFLMYGLLLVAVYFIFFRPSMQAKKVQEEKIKGARTGDKIITSGGIHGVITNVKDSTVILRIADNVKIEVEKGHIDKITRSDSESDKADKSEKTTKAA